MSYNRLIRNLEVINQIKTLNERQISRFVFYKKGLLSIKLM